MQDILEKNLFFFFFLCLPLHALCVSVAPKHGAFGDGGKGIPPLTSYRSVSEFSD